MKTLRDLLLLGDPRLYKKSDPITEQDMSLVSGWVGDLANVMNEIRIQYKFGRGIAAPQLGIMKRLIYIDTHQKFIIINPQIVEASKELFEVWDDCMCFPQLFVKVNRHRSIRFKYKDEDWKDQELEWKDDMAELFQHEYDHLEGVLCTMRALDDKSFKWRSI